MRVATGRRVSSGGRPIDTGGRGRPVPTSVGRTLEWEELFKTVKMVSIEWEELLKIFFIVMSCGFTPSSSTSRARQW